MDRRTIFGLLLLFSLLEAGMLTFWRNIFGPYISPIIWIFAGVATALSALAYALFTPMDAPGLKVSEGSGTSRKVGTVLIFLAGTMLCAWLLQGIFDRVPIDSGISDIIPSMQVYVKRWLAGENVYAPIQYDGWVVVPTYLPFLWMPYSVAELLSIDYRWIAYSMFLLGLAIHYRSLYASAEPFVFWLIKALFPFVLLGILLTDRNADIFGMSVELLPAGLYLILSRTLFHRYWWVALVGVLLCLLSRWAFTFWLPVYLLAFLLQKGWIQAIKMGVGMTLGIILLFVIPFLLPNWDVIKEEMKIYPRTAKGRWQPEFWQSAGEKPYHLKQGLSVALFFYDYAPGSFEERLSANRRVHKWVCFLAGILVAGGYFWVQKKKGHIPFYFLAGLKFYLVLFYGFFYVPFLYLFQLPLVLSIPLILGVGLHSHSASAAAEESGIQRVGA